MKYLCPFAWSCPVKHNHTGNAEVNTAVQCGTLPKVDNVSYKISVFVSDVSPTFPQVQFNFELIRPAFDPLSQQQPGRVLLTVLVLLVTGKGI